jgi:hypothetical protein
MKTSLAIVKVSSSQRLHNKADSSNQHYHARAASYNLCCKNGVAVSQWSHQAAGKGLESKYEQRRQYGPQHAQG